MFLYSGNIYTKRVIHNLEESALMACGSSIVSLIFRIFNILKKDLRILALRCLISSKRGLIIENETKIKFINKAFLSLHY